MSIDSVNPSTEQSTIIDDKHEDNRCTKQDHSPAVKDFQHPNPTASFAKLRAEGEVLRASREQGFPLTRSLFTRKGNLTLSKLLADSPSPQKDRAIFSFFLSTCRSAVEQDDTIYLQVIDELKALTKEFDDQNQAATFWGEIHIIEFEENPIDAVKITKGFLNGLKCFSLSNRMVVALDYSEETRKIIEELQLDKPTTSYEKRILRQAIIEHFRLMCDYMDGPQLK